jgi:hypothetical protein
VSNQAKETSLWGFVDELAALVLHSTIYSKLDLGSAIRGHGYRDGRGPGIVQN